MNQQIFFNCIIFWIEYWVKQYWFEYWMNHFLAKFKNWIESDWVSDTTTRVPNKYMEFFSEKLLIFSKKIKCSKQPKKQNKLNFHFSLSGVPNVRGRWVGSDVWDKVPKKTKSFFWTFPWLVFPARYFRISLQAVPAWGEFQLDAFANLILLSFTSDK